MDKCETQSFRLRQGLVSIQKKARVAQLNQLYFLKNTEFFGANVQKTMAVGQMERIDISAASLYHNKKRSGSFIRSQLTMELLPETALFSSRCLDEDFYFYSEAAQIRDKIVEIVDSFSKADYVYPNNIIGVIGGRGSGKTSLLASITATLTNREAGFFKDSKENIKVRPIAQPIDPKTVPSFIGVVDLVIANLFNYFQNESKLLSEREADSLYQQFEDLNRTAAILCQSSRKDVIENPSDLADLSALSNLRQSLEKLIADLHKAFGDPEKSAFLLSIDDFDVDGENCHRMALELNSYLNAKGIIFLLAMDAEIFQEELYRARVKELSDYGKATNALLMGNQLYERPIARARGSEKIANEVLENIKRSSKKYAQQLISKLIPSDFVIEMQERDLSETQDVFASQIDTLCLYLFGVNASPSKGAVDDSVPVSIDKFIQMFRRSLTRGKDLRATSQMINGIFRKMNSAANEKPSDGFFVFLQKTFSSVSASRSGDERSLLNCLSFYLKFVTLDKESRRRAIGDASLTSRIIVDEDNTIDVMDIIGNYCIEYPGAFAMYELAVANMDFRSDDLVHGYHDLLKFFSKSNPDETEKIKDVKKQTDGTFSFNYGELTIEASDLVASFEVLNRAAVGDEIALLLKIKPGKLTKKKLWNIYAIISSYNKAVNDDSLAGHLDDLARVLNVPWKGQENTVAKDKSIADARQILYRIKRGL